MATGYYWINYIKRIKIAFNRAARKMKIRKGICPSCGTKDGVKGCKTCNGIGGGWFDGGGA